MIGDAYVIPVWVNHLVERIDNDAAALSDTIRRLPNHRKRLARRVRMCIGVRVATEIIDSTSSVAHLPITRAVAAGLGALAKLLQRTSSVDPRAVVTLVFGTNHKPVIATFGGAPAAW